MSVHVVDRALIVCDRSSHHAKSVGQGGWVVSFLPGRTLTTVQATAAIQVAEAAAEVEKLAMLIGLTAREAFGLACAMHAEIFQPLVGDQFVVAARPDARFTEVVPRSRRGGGW